MDGKIEYHRFAESREFHGRLGGYEVSTGFVVSCVNSRIIYNLLIQPMRIANSNGWTIFMMLSTMQAESNNGRVHSVQLMNCAKY